MRLVVPLNYFVQHATSPRTSTTHFNRYAVLGCHCVFLASRRQFLEGLQLQQGMRNVTYRDFSIQWNERSVDRTKSVWKKITVPSTSLHRPRIILSIKDRDKTLRQDDVWLFRAQYLSRKHQPLCKPSKVSTVRSVDDALVKVDRVEISMTEMRI